MILAGEHSVVYGHTAIAAPITLVISLTETATGRFVAPGLNLDLAMDDPHPLLDTFRSVVPWRSRPVSSGLQIDGTLPPGLGMGFSAALSVAIARQFCIWAAIPAHQTAFQVRNWAHALENRFHGGASGLDVEAVLVPYALEFRRGEPIVPIDVMGAFHFVGAAFPVVANTKQCVAQVRAMRDADPSADLRIVEMGTLAHSVGACLRQGNDRDLGQIFNQIHAHLTYFGLATDPTQAAVESALKAGAYGAKISGAGGGGLVIAVAPSSKLASIEQSWRGLAPVLQFRHTLS